MKLKEIGRRLGCEVHGDGEVEITGAAGIDEATPDQITFVSNTKYVTRISSTRAGAIILSKPNPAAELPTLIAKNPYLTFARVLELFYTPPVPIPGIHPTAIVDDTAELGEGCSIGAGVVIGPDVRLGDNAVVHPCCVLYPGAIIGDDFYAHSHAVVREHCQIGDRVILQNGAVIGADGFGFAPEGDGNYYKIVQAGIVVIEDDVEIGAYSCVDRATVGETRISRGTKLDNLVQIGHGSRVGRDCVLAAQVGLAGSSHVGNQVMLAGQVGVAGHLTIGDKAVVTAQSGIAHSIEAGRRVSGSPEMDTRTWIKNSVLFPKLPEMNQQLKRLQKRVEELEAALEQRDQS